MATSRDAAPTGAEAAALDSIEAYLERLRGLSDQEVVDRLRRSVTRERGSSALVLAHLGEIEDRGLHFAAGYASLFVYCTLVLHYSEHAAYNRIVAARISRRFPIILRAVAEGIVHLTAVRLLAPLMTEENHNDLLSLARHRTRREVEELIARLRPRPAAIQSIRRLPFQDHFESDGGGSPDCRSAEGDSALGDVAGDEAARGAMATSPSGHAYDASDIGVGNHPSANGRCSCGANPGDIEGCTCKTAGAEFGSNADDADGASSSSVEHELNLIVDSDPDDTALERIPPGRAEPLAPGLYRVQFTAGALLHSRLRRAQDLLRHRIPNGDLALILDLALRLLIERIEARRLGRVARSIRERNALRASRYVPVALRREVWLRDGGRCAFVSDAGVRCDATTLLEFHHRHPFALGGPHAAANLELRCRGHNQYEADLVFGGQATAGASPLAARAGPT